MKESCQRSTSSSLVNAQPSLVTIHFPNDGFLLMQIAGGGTMAVFAFQAYSQDHLGTSMLFIFFAILLVLVRAKFKTRPPEWAVIDSINKTLRLKQRWPHRSEIEIDIAKLQSVEACVPRFQRFAVSVVDLHFADKEMRRIFFDVESSETRFFATPNEVVPPSVEELVEVLRKVSIENESHQ